MSAKSTWYLPARIARPFAPSTRYCAGPRAGAVREILVDRVERLGPRRGGSRSRPRGRDEPGGVADDAVGDRHAADELLQPQHFVRSEHAVGLGGELAGRPLDDLHLFIDRRVLHLQVEHEPVELGLRQRIGPFHFDRVLRGDDEERRLELVRLAADRDFAFLHGLQQGGLRLGRRAVDFVGQQEVGEDRPLHERHAVLAGRLILFHHVGAGDVGRHQVGRELHAAELHLERAGQRAGHQRLAQARHAVQQNVPAAQQANQQRVDDLVLADDDLGHLGLDPVAGLAQAGDDRPGLRSWWRGARKPRRA